MAYVLDQSQTTDTVEAYTYGWPQYPYLAQSFTPTVTADIGKVSLALAKVGTPIDNPRISICADNAGEPGSELCVSTTTVDPGDLPGQYDTPVYTDFEFAEGTELTANTVYWIKYSRTGDFSDTNYYFSRISSEYTGYTRGELLYYDTEVGWSSEFPDSAFEEYYILISYCVVRSLYNTHTLYDDHSLYNCGAEPTPPSVVGWKTLLGVGQG